MMKWNSLLPGLEQAVVPVTLGWDGVRTKGWGR